MDPLVVFLSIYNIFAAFAKKEHTIASLPLYLFSL